VSESGSSREEESCNEKVKKVTINIVTISGLARLVYNKFMTKYTEGENTPNLLEFIWLVRNPSASLYHNQGEL
jgi:hypothetical protein